MALKQEQVQVRRGFIWLVGSRDSHYAEPTKRSAEQLDGGQGSH